MIGRCGIAQAATQQPACGRQWDDAIRRIRRLVEARFALHVEGREDDVVVLRTVERIDLDRRITHGDERGQVVALAIIRIGVSPDDRGSSKPPTVIRLPLASSFPSSKLPAFSVSGSPFTVTVER
jgi:hypothetical protein